ncbi:MAG: hypothetical protein PGN13_15065 [Patulibacter minatonensis]
MSTKVTRYHGPDRAPLELGPGGIPATRDGIAFHGIAPRGLMPWLDEHLGGAAGWQRHGHRLDDGTPAGSPELASLRHAARAAGVLSLAHSAQAAELAARQAQPSATHLALWLFKEGHSSSVWVVDARTPGGDAAFVLNVARDAVAGAELRRSSERLGAVERAAAVQVASVEAVDTVVLDEPAAHGGAWEVVVVRNRLIPDALEIHELSGDAGRQYALVERFLTNPLAPAVIDGVRGRLALPAEAAAIDAARAAVEAALGCEGDDALVVNDGDLVWNGHEPVLVAVS